MIRFGLEVANLSETVELLRKNVADLIYAINQKDSELAHVDFMYLKLSLNQFNDRVTALTRAYEMQLADDAVKKNN